MNLQSIRLECVKYKKGHSKSKFINFHYKVFLDNEKDVIGIIHYRAFSWHFQARDFTIDFSSQLLYQIREEIIFLNKLWRDK